jgi:hypothetical protein
LSVVLNTEERRSTAQSSISKRSDKVVQSKVSNELRNKRISKDDYAHEIAIVQNKKSGKLI